MSWQAVDWVLRSSQAENAVRLVAVVLASHADERGEKIWPSIPTIAREARIGESTVRAAIETLKGAGELEETGTGPRSVRCFRLVMESRAAPAREVRSRPHQKRSDEAPLPPQDLRGSPGSAPPQDLHPSPGSGARPPQDLATTPAGSAPEPSRNHPQQPPTLVEDREALSPSPLGGSGRTDVAREASQARSDEDPAWVKATIRESLAVASNGIGGGGA